MSDRIDVRLLAAKFAKTGPRVRVADRPAARFRTAGAVALDVRAFAGPGRPGR